MTAEPPIGPPAREPGDDDPATQRSIREDDNPEVGAPVRRLSTAPSAPVLGGIAAAIVPDTERVATPKPVRTPPAEWHGEAASASAEWDAARAATAIYTTHYQSLLRLAVLLVRDIATAEEVVQDSFIGMHAAWHRLRDTEKALSYLRQSVVNRSRSVLRRRVVADKNAPMPEPDMPSAEEGAISALERSAVISALRTLPPRQREALVLKYYADLSEAQIAATLGISRGAVKSNIARAAAALRSVLDLEA